MLGKGVSLTREDPNKTLLPPTISHSLQITVHPLMARALHKSSGGLHDRLKLWNAHLSSFDEAQGTIVITPTANTKPGWEEECKDYIQSEYALIEEQISKGPTYSVILTNTLQAVPFTYELRPDGTVHKAAGGINAITKLQTTTSQSRPLQITVHPLIVKVLHKSSDGLRDKLKLWNAHLSGMNEAQGTIVITPTAYTKPGWEEECKDYIHSKYTVIEEQIPRQALVHVYRVFSTIPQQAVFTHELNHDETVLKAAGDTNTISKLRTIIEEHTQIHKEVALSLEDYEFVSQVKVTQIKVAHPDVTISLIPQKQSLLLNGPACSVHKLQKSLHLYAQHTLIPVRVNPHIVSYLSTECGRQKLISFALLRCQVAVYFNQYQSQLTVLLLCVPEHTTQCQALAQGIEKETMVKTLSIPKLLAPVLSTLENYKQLSLELQREHGVIICSSGQQVTLVGFQKDVEISEQSLDTFIDQQCESFQPFQIPVGTVVGKALYKNREGLQNALQAHLHVKFHFDRTHGVVVVSPTQYMKSNWREECEQQVLSYINSVKHVIPIPKQGVDDINPLLNLKHQEDILFAVEFNYDQDPVLLTVVADANTLEVITAKANEIHSDYDVTSYQETLTPEEYIFVSQAKQHQICADYPKVSVTFHQSTYSIHLRGSARSVKQLKQELTSHSLHERVEVRMSDPLIVQYLNTRVGVQKLKQLFQEKQWPNVAFHFASHSQHVHSLLLLCDPGDVDSVRATVEPLQKEFVVVPLSIPGTSTSLDPRAHFLEDYRNLLCYELSSDGTILKAAGDISTITRLQTTIGKHVQIDKEAALSPEDYEFVSQVKVRQIRDAYPNVTITLIPQKHSLLLNGPACSVNQLQQSLHLYTHHIPVPVQVNPQIANYLSTECGRQKLCNLIAVQHSQVAVYFNKQQSPLTLQLLCVCERTAQCQAAAHAIEKETLVETLSIPELLASALSELDDYKLLSLELQSEQGVQISTSDRQVTLVGFQKGVVTSKQSLLEFMNQRCESNQPLQITVETLVGKALCMNQEGLTNALQEHLHVKLTINKAQGVVVISPTKYMKFNWREECEEQISSYVKSIKSVIPIPKQGLDDIYPLLLSKHVEDIPFAFEFNYDQDPALLTVVADTNTLEVINAKASEIRSDYDVTTWQRTLPPEEYAFISQVKKHQIRAYYPQLSVTCHQLTNSIQLCGSNRSVKQLTLEFTSHTFHERVQVNMSDPLIAQYLNTSTGLNQLKHVFQEKQWPTVAFHFERISHSQRDYALWLLCDPGDIDSVQDAVEQLQKEFVVVSLSIPGTFTSLDPQAPFFEEYKQFCQNLESKYQVIVEDQHLNHTVKVAGLASCVKFSVQEIDKFFKRVCTVTQETQVDRGMWRLFQNYMHEVSDCEQKGVEVFRLLVHKSLKKLAHAHKYGLWK